jgi:transposase InsO family protein
MGKLSDDDIMSMLILNAMNTNFGPLQHSISSLSNSPNFNSELMSRRVLDEDAFILRRTEAGQSANPYTLSPSTVSSTAFAALSPRDRPPRPVCANCKKDTHGTDYCIAPGGKMAGRTIDEARAARTAAREKLHPRPSQSAHVATPVVPSAAPSSSSQGTIFLNGKLYAPVEPSWSMAPTPSSAHIAEIDPSDSFDYPYHAFVAFSDSALSASSSDLSSSDGSLPFIIDSGASCHISPFLSDFKSIRPIKPHPITGLGNSSVSAVGMGTIELCTPSGTLSLLNALYVPSSSVRLISVFLLGEANFNAHFYPREGHCFISNAANAIITRGTALPGRKLFVLSSFSVPVHIHPSFPSSAHYTSRLPDVHSWHKRLGHCGPRAVLDMARSNVVEGMRIDTSSTPPKCQHCILGKQTRSAVPKVREGARASKQLERVYVDLCGPMSVASRTGRLYSMNIIDDYSSFVWSLPLRSKAEAAVALKHWLTAMEVQTPHRLQSFVTDNGELASNHIRDWCSEKGILHLFTAPYTSAQNGRAERLHRTLLDKARAMKSACNAPTDMWDEFVATAAYLTNLTGASANGGVTPFELWFGSKPSVSHLREIGCRAFALIPTNNPKVHHRSLPCMLIGYAPNSKAFRLWDPPSNKIFNSYHVSFIEDRELPSSPAQRDTTSPITQPSTPSHPAFPPVSFSHLLQAPHVTITSQDPVTPQAPVSIIPQAPTPPQAPIIPQTPQAPVSVIPQAPQAPVSVIPQPPQAPVTITPQTPVSVDTRSIRLAAATRAIGHRKSADRPRA